MVRPIRNSWRLAALALLIAPLLSAQSVKLIRTCGKVGDKVCISGSGWAEPNPLCRYLFTMDGATIAPDQQDGLYGPPSTNFTVPAVAVGNHTVLVQLVLNDANSTLLQQATAPFKVVNNASAGSLAGAGAGTTTFTGTLTVPDECVFSCKRIVFNQTVQRTVVKASDGSTVITKATDWNGMPDAAKKAAVETATRTRVDNYWGIKAPYYNTAANGSIPAAGGNAFGVVGSTTPTQINATMTDTPGNSFANFNGGFAISKTVLNYTSAPFCIEGDDSGKYVGFVVTWTDTETSATSGAKVGNINVTAGQPSADFIQAVKNWDAHADHAFALPQPQQQTKCLYN